ncbi:hypothetical protein [Haloarcula sediminis]|uniref:hypothetical protein n=1 Tax=Haloarcula sediminis TaxID=3111777 RepID=UPI002D79B402|nr:hypothetical protein [Haloarcula sp. CK38]
MPSIIEKLVLREPAGRPNSWIQFVASLAFLGIYAWSAGGDSSGSWLLVMAVASALSGVAESLPKDRHLLAGVFRLTAISALLCLLAAIVFVPEFIVGRPLTGVGRH